MAMTGDKIEKVLEIKVQYDKAVGQLGNYRKTLDEIALAEKKLKNELSAGKISSEDYAHQMVALAQQSKAVKSEMQGLTRVVQNQIKEEYTQRGSIAQLRAQLSNLTREYDNMSRSARNGKEGIMKMTEINKVTKEIKDAEMATQRFYRNVGNYRDALAGVGQLTSGFKVLGTTIAGIMGGLGLQQLSTRMIQIVRDFEDGIARVRAVTNPLAGDFDKLRNKALELGRATRYTATEVASGMEVLGRLGLTANQTLDAITPTLHLAQANAISLADAADISASAMRAFGMQTDDLTKINDVFSSACSHSATNMSLLGEAMKTAAPMARTLNIPLEETTAMIGGLANVGMTGSDAGTGIKQIITALASAHTTEKGLEVLKKYNLQIDALTIKEKGLIPILKEMKESGIGNSPEDLKTLGGKYAIPRFATLIQNIEQVEALNETLKNSFGENDRMFNQSLGTTSNAIYTLQSTWDTFLIDVNDSTSMYLIKPLEWLRSFIQVMSSEISAIGQLVVSVLASIALKPFFQGVINNYKIGVAEMSAASEKSIAKNKASLLMANNEYIEALKARGAVQHRITSENAAYEKRVMDLQAKQNDMRLKARTGQTAAERQRYLALAQQYDRIEEQVTRTHIAKLKALNKELTDAKIIEKEKETTLLEVENEKQVLNEQQKVGRVMKAWNTLKAGAMGVVGVFRAAFNTIKGFAIITLIFEAIQALGNLYNTITEVDTKLEDLNKTIGESQHNDRIKRLEQISRLLKENTQKINEAKKSHKDTNDLLNEKLRLEGLVNGALDKNLVKEKGVLYALYQQIKAAKELARTRAYADAYTKTQNEALDIATRNGMEYDVSDPKSIKSLVSQLGAKVGMDTPDKSFVSRLLQTLKAPSLLGGVVWNTLTGMNTKGGDYVKVHNLEKYLDEILKNYDPDKDIADDAQKAIDEIIAGDAKPTPDFTKKTKGDPELTLKNLLDKWKKKKLDLDADILRDPIAKMRQETISEFEKLNIETEKVLDANGTDWAEHIGKNIKKAIDKYPEMAAQLKSVIIEVRKEALIKASIELEKVQLESQKKELEREKTHQEEMNALIESYLAQRNNLEMSDLEIYLKEKTVKATEEQEKIWGEQLLEWKDQLLSNQKERIQLRRESLIKENSEALKQIRENARNEIAEINKTQKEKIAALNKDWFEKEAQLSISRVAGKITQEDYDKQSKSLRENAISNANMVNKEASDQRSIVRKKASDEASKYSLSLAEYDSMATIQVTNEDASAIQKYGKMQDAKHKAELEALAKDKDVIALTKDIIKERLDLLSQQEQIAKKDAIDQQELDDIALREKLLKTPGVTDTADEIYKKASKYAESRDTIERKKVEDSSYTSEQSEEDIKKLNAQYGAEAQALQDYYISRKNIDLKYQIEDENRRTQYAKKRAEEEKRLWDELKQIQLQGIQNKFQELQNGYLRETALGNDHYRNLEYGSTEYWQRLQGRVGERNALELQSEYEQYQKELELFNQTKENQYESHEAYEARRIELEQKGLDIHVKTNDAIQKSDLAQLEAASSILGGLEQIVQSATEGDEEAAKMAKVIALAKIAIDTGKAIADATAWSAGEGPVGWATLAGKIATIMANIATAISTVKSAHFAQGGVNIQGAGTSTSDSIPAYISNGESVMNAKATKMFEPLLLAMNAIGNGVALPRNNYIQTQQTADLSESFSQAVANIRPVVDVQEITRTQNRVEVIQNLDTL